MNKTRIREFDRRVYDFQKTHKGGNAVSIKMRITSGCFERRCSPNAWKIIDDYVKKNYSKIKNGELVTHESGPEILLQLALTTAKITLAKSIIDLVIAIIKATSKGIKKGDKAKWPMELIVRRIDSKSECI